MLCAIAHVYCGADVSRSTAEFSKIHHFSRGIWQTHFCQMFFHKLYTSKIILNHTISKVGKPESTSKEFICAEKFSVLGDACSCHHYESCF